MPEWKKKMKVSKRSCISIAVSELCDVIGEFSHPSLPFTVLHTDSPSQRNAERECTNEYVFMLDGRTYKHDE